MALRKIDLMYELFGKSEQLQCKDCEHLKKYRYYKKTYYKCEIYGNSDSEATDWRLKQTACGMFDKPYKTDVPIVRMVRPERKQETQIDGQLSIFGGV